VLAKRTGARAAGSAPASAEVDLDRHRALTSWAELSEFVADDNWCWFVAMLCPSHTSKLGFP
jgi:hypothetical protein